MKKSLVMVIVSLCVVSLVFAGVASASTLNIVGDGQNNTDFSTGRTLSDYKAALKDLVNADEVGDVIHPEENDFRYLFVPLKKDGELIGYGTWVNTVIYQHPEDIIAVVSPEGIIEKWKPIDANSHHPELQKEAYLGRFYGMTLKTDFNPEIDVISGSTYSSNTFFFELRNILVTFKDFGPGKKEEK